MIAQIWKTNKINLSKKNKLATHPLKTKKLTLEVNIFDRYLTFCTEFMLKNEFDIVMSQPLL